jgi:hypothetical protein
VNPQATMQLEFHQLERRWEHLRVRQPQRQRRLMASLAESGQQTPIVVVLSSGERERYLEVEPAGPLGLKERHRTHAQNLGGQDTLLKTSLIPLAPPSNRTLSPRANLPHYQDVCASSINASTRLDTRGGKIERYRVDIPGIKRLRRPPDMDLRDCTLA